MLVQGAILLTGRNELSSVHLASTPCISSAGTLEPPELVGLCVPSRGEPTALLQPLRMGAFNPQHPSGGGHAYLTAVPAHYPPMSLVDMTGGHRQPPAMIAASMHPQKPVIGMGLEKYPAAVGVNFPQPAVARYF